MTTSRFARAAGLFDESQHPREDDGKFAYDGGPERSSKSDGERGSKQDRAPGTVTKKGMVCANGKTIKIGDRVAVRREQGFAGETFTSTAYGEVKSLNETAGVGVKLEGGPRLYYEPDAVFKGEGVLSGKAAESTFLEGHSAEAITEVAGQTMGTVESFMVNGHEYENIDAAAEFGKHMTASVSRFARRAYVFDEEAHPRDAGGRFATKESAAARTEAPIGDEGPVRDTGERTGLWHLTDDPFFRPDPHDKPDWNSLAGDLIGDARPEGLFVGDPEYWMHAYGYERPYVAEIVGTVTDPPGAVMHEGREHFVQGDDMHTARVLTLDEYAREHYGEPGWVETYFDDDGGMMSPDSYYWRMKREIGPDYRARSVDQMTPEEVADYEQRFAKYAERPSGPLAQSRSAGLFARRAYVFDEAAHPRDTQGRFTSGGGGGSPSETPALDLLTAEFEAAHGTVGDRRREMDRIRENIAQRETLLQVDMGNGQRYVITGFSPFPSSSPPTARITVENLSGDRRAYDVEFPEQGFGHDGQLNISDVQTRLEERLREDFGVQPSPEPINEAQWATAQETLADPRWRDATFDIPGADAYARIVGPEIIDGEMKVHALITERDGTEYSVVTPLTQDNFTSDLSGGYVLNGGQLTLDVMDAAREQLGMQVEMTYRGDESNFERYDAERYDAAMGTAEQILQSALPEDFVGRLQSYGGDGIFHFHSTSAPRGREGEGGTVAFSVDGDRLHIGQMMIDESLQDHGLGTAMVGAIISAAEQMNLGAVEFLANISVGGYAWARMGAYPTDRAWSTLQDQIATRGLEFQRWGEGQIPIETERNLAALLDGPPQNITKIAEMDDPIKISNEVTHLIPSNIRLGEGGTLPLGKALLFGTSWAAQIPVGDQAAREEFAQYTAEKEAEKQAVAAAAEPARGIGAYVKRDGTLDDATFWAEVLNDETLAPADEKATLRAALQAIDTALAALQSARRAYTAETFEESKVRREHGRFARQDDGGTADEDPSAQVNAGVDRIKAALPDAVVRVNFKFVEASRHSEQDYADAVDGVATGFERMAAQYPEVASRIGTIELGQTDSGKGLGQYLHQGSGQKYGDDGELAPSGAYAGQPRPLIQIDIEDIAERAYGLQGVREHEVVSHTVPAERAPLDTQRLTEGIAVHEFGHAMYYAAPSAVAMHAATDVAWSKHQFDAHISDYAGSNPHEYFAEAFTAQELGMGDRLDDSDRIMLRTAGVDVSARAAAPPQVVEDPPPDTFEGSIIWEYAAQEPRTSAFDETKWEREHGRFHKYVGPEAREEKWVDDASEGSRVRQVEPRGQSESRARYANEGMVRARLQAAFPNAEIKRTAGWRDIHGDMTAWMSDDSSGVEEGSEMWQEEVAIAERAADRVVAVYDGLEQMAEQFPESAARVTSIDMAPGYIQGGMADAVTILGPGKVDMEFALDRITDRDEPSDFNISGLESIAQDDLRYWSFGVAVHEFGHVVDSHAATVEHGAEFTSDDYMAHNFGQSNAPLLIAAWDAPEYFEGHFEQAADDVSFYATTEPGEYTAEVFAQSRLDPSSMGDEARDIAVWLEDRASQQVGIDVRELMAASITPQTQPDGTPSLVIVDVLDGDCVPVQYALGEIAPRTAATGGPAEIIREIPDKFRGAAFDETLHPRDRGRFTFKDNDAEQPEKEATVDDGVASWGAHGAQHRQMQDWAAGIVAGDPMPEGADPTLYAETRALVDAARSGVDSSGDAKADGRWSGGSILYGGSRWTGRGFPKQGDEIDLPLQSFAREQRIGEHFAQGRGDEKGRPVLFKTYGDQPGVDVWARGGFGDEKEFLISGRYTVTESRTDDGIRQVSLKRIEPRVAYTAENFDESLVHREHGRFAHEDGGETAPGPTADTGQQIAGIIDRLDAGLVEGYGGDRQPGRDEKWGVSNRDTSFYSHPWMRNNGFIESRIGDAQAEALQALTDQYGAEKAQNIEGSIKAWATSGGGAMTDEAREYIASQRTTDVLYHGDGDAAKYANARVGRNIVFDDYKSWTRDRNVAEVFRSNTETAAKQGKAGVIIQLAPGAVGADISLLGAPEYAWQRESVLEPQKFRVVEKTTAPAPTYGGQNAGTVVVLKVEPVAARAAAGFVEEEHPRDRGRFTFKDGEAQPAGPPVTDAGESPLKYTAHSEPVERLAIVDPTAPVETRETYFKPEGYEERSDNGGMNVPRERRTYEHRDGPEPGTVAFLDYHREGNDIGIDYASTRNDQQGQGLATRLVDALYEKFPDSTINWGRIMDPTMRRMYERLQDEKPDQTGTAKIDRDAYWEPNRGASVSRFARRAYTAETFDESRVRREHGRFARQDDGGEEPESAAASAGAELAKIATSRDWGPAKRDGDDEWRRWGYSAVEARNAAADAKRAMLAELEVHGYNAEAIDLTMGIWSGGAPDIVREQVGSPDPDNPRMVPVWIGANQMAEVASETEIGAPVHRAVLMSDEQVAQLAPGIAFNGSALESWSRDREVAKDFGIPEMGIKPLDGNEGTTQVVMTMSDGHGVDVAPLGFDTYVWQDEVLVAGDAYRIDAVTPAPEGESPYPRLYVDVTAVSLADLAAVADPDELGRALTGPSFGEMSIAQGHPPDKTTERYGDDVQGLMARPEPREAATRERARSPQQIMSGQIRSARMLRDRLATAKRDVVRQLAAGAEVAFAEALRLAGVRAISKARNKQNRAASVTVATAFDNRQSLVPFFAALGVNERTLLQGSFSAYQEQVAKWLAEYRREQRRIAEDEGWGDEGDDLVAGDDNTDNAAAVFLGGALFALAASRLLAGDDPTVEARGEVSGVVPTGLVLRALDVANGGAHATLGESPTAMPTLVSLDRVDVERLIAEGLRDRLRDSLTGELRAREDTGRPTASIERALDDLEAEPPLTEYVWAHGFYGEPKQRFDPHFFLDGERFVGGPAPTEGPSPIEADDRLINTTGWPDTPYYFPGDHLGCTCELVAQVPSALDAYVDAVA